MTNPTDGISWHTVQVPHAELAWTSEGTGPATVWAHGISSSSFGMDEAGLFDWSPIAASGRRLIRYDARGHGRSTGRPVPEDFTFPHLAEDLLTLLDAVAPAEQVSGIGSSMGTSALLYAAIRDPGRFDRLVLTSPPTAWETRPPQAAMYRGVADLIEAEGVSAFTAMVAKAGSPEIFRELAAFPPRQDAAGELLPAMMRGVGASDLPAPEDIAALRMPVLILAWTTDPGHPVSTARRLAELIPDARLELAETVEQLRTWGAKAAGFLS